ncbi:GtrA family protein [Xenophilus arseniciresistens]|uniref:GtrA family protein n=1 Tax=Xenophilus arseniciresistens TaxID=1283306 RepID=A0AAE3T1V9_9BURK|nr:GtrA family protein [Xenophilus arseniciresistens]MDA7418371.1 GtrA family protein [Xenophilus arseniciresistens]
MPDEPARGPAALSTLQRLWRFGVAGVLGFVVDAGVLYLLAPWLGWYGARVLSFWAAATATWLFNRRYTFADGAARGGAALWREYGGYLLAMLGGAAVNYGCYALALQLLPPAGWVPLLGVAVGSLAGMGINFLSARWLIFRRQR